MAKAIPRYSVGDTLFTPFGEMEVAWVYGRHVRLESGEKAVCLWPGGFATVDGCGRADTGAWGRDVRLRPLGFRWEPSRLRRLWVRLRWWLRSRPAKPAPVVGPATAAAEISTVLLVLTAVVLAVLLVFICSACAALTQPTLSGIQRAAVPLLPFARFSSFRALLAYLNALKQPKQ